jgi:large repetitive protein
MTGDRWPVRLAGVAILVGLVAVVVVATAAALRFNDESYLTPEGVVGSPYYHRFGAPPAGGGGAGCDPPYIFQVDSGSFPPGLSLGSRSGEVTGTPTQAGTFTFYASIKDDPTDKPWCNPLSAEREFTIRILQKLTIGPESLRPGTVGTSYSVAMTFNLSEPKAWSISAGALPPGLALDRVSGVISGRPTAAGAYSFTMLAVVDPKRSDTKALSIVIRDPLRVSAGAAGRAPPGEVGVAFSQQLQATGGSGTNTWAVTGSLPPGLALSPSGVLSGKPTKAGSWRFAISVADDEGRTATLDELVAVATRLAVATRALPPAAVGQPYKARLARSGGVAPLSWRIASGRLPRGLRLDRVSGVLLGTPARPGTTHVVLECIDALRARATRSYDLVVGA